MAASSRRPGARPRASPATRPWPSSNRVRAEYDPDGGLFNSWMGRIYGQRSVLWATATTRHAVRQVLLKPEMVPLPQHARGGVAAWPPQVGMVCCSPSTTPRARWMRAISRPRTATGFQTAAWYPCAPTCPGSLPRCGHGGSDWHGSDTRRQLAPAGPSIGAVEGRRPGQRRPSGAQRRRSAGR